MYNNILFLDIETVPRYPGFEGMPEDWKALWEHKASHLSRDPEKDSPESLYERAGIYAEFGKIICISCGILSGHGVNRKIAIKSFFGDDEKLVLLTFSDMLNRWSAEGNKYLCAHNGKEFDFPYICRRMIINGLALPPLLRITGKKPWELPFIDTMELWKFGEYKNFASLNLLAFSLGIPTPKDDMDGSMVAEIYWQEKDLPRIAVYCQKDVVTAAQVYLRMNGEPMIAPENIEIR